MIHQHREEVGYDRKRCSIAGIRPQYPVQGWKENSKRVNSATFELRRGKTLCIVGESGCGKSVTAHSIMQLLPKAGYIKNGKVEYFKTKDEVTTLSTLKRNGKAIRSIRGRDIAMIFQDPMSSLDPVYTIGRQIAENLRNHENISKKDARVRIIKLLNELAIPSPEKGLTNTPTSFRRYEAARHDRDSAHMQS